MCQHPPVLNSSCSERMTAEESLLHPWIKVNIIFRPLNVF